MRRVARQFGVDPSDLRGPDRRPLVLWPRQVSMYLARQLTGRSLAQVGAYFGRDHSTVRHACQRVVDARRMDPAMAAVLKQLEAELG